MTIRNVSIDLTCDQVDLIVLSRLKEDFKLLQSTRNRFGDAYENDFFKSIKWMIRYYMIESEYQEWLKENS